MAQTYLDVLNVALGDVNEPPLNTTTFLSPRGIHLFAKNAVNRSLVDLANECTEWSWLKSDTVLTPSTQTTTQGVVWYNLGVSNPAWVDFDTFFLTTADTNQRLERITYQEWDNLYRELDATAEGQPLYVIETDEPNQFGISPPPDKAYTIKYNTWAYVNLLSAATDIIPFPEQFFNVLVARIRYYLWDFKDDQNKASRAQSEYIYGINRMRERLTAKESTRMRFI